MFCVSFSSSFMSPVAYRAISWLSLSQQGISFPLCPVHFTGVSELTAPRVLWEMNLQALKMRNTEDHKDCTICATLLYCTEGQLQMKFCVEWKLANPKLIACSWHNLVFQGGQFDLWLTSFSWSGLGIELWLFNDVPKQNSVLLWLNWEWVGSWMYIALFWSEARSSGTTFNNPSDRKLHEETELPNKTTLAHCDKLNMTRK